jgi:hypothetical protein
MELIRKNDVCDTGRAPEITAAKLGGLCTNMTVTTEENPLAQVITAVGEEGAIDDVMSVNSRSAAIDATPMVSVIDSEMESLARE